MGNCVNSRSRIQINYNGSVETVQNIPDLELLKLKIEEKFQIPIFDMFVDTKQLLTKSDFEFLIENKKDVEVTIKKKEDEKVKPSLKHLITADKVEVKVPSGMEDYLYTVIDKSDNPIFSTVLILKQYLLLNKKYVPKNPAVLRLMVKTEKEWLIPLKETDDFWLFKIQRSDLPSVPEESCVGFTKKAKIFMGGELSMTQDQNYSDLYKSSEDLNDKFLGFPVFSKQNLIGYISEVLSSHVYLVSAEKLAKELIPSTIRVRRKRAPKEIKPSSTMPRNSNLKNQLFNRTAKASSVSTEDDLVIKEKPDQFSYIFSLPDKLISYHSSHQGTSTTNISLDITDISSLTSTPIGLIVVTGRETVKIVNNTKVSLGLLNNHRENHVCLWHLNKVYVIGGTGTRSVEYLDENSEWTEDIDIPEVRENPAACSAFGAIYLMGGRENKIFVDTVFKYTDEWELLSWRCPLKIEGFALVPTDGCFLIFGGNGKLIKNKRYYIVDSNGTEISRGSSPVTGMFSRCSYGLNNNTYTFLLSEDQAMEYASSFKVYQLG